jgi:hypothetical protein
MPVTASITFEQDATSPGAGISMVGVGGSLVTLTNADNTGVIQWTWELLDSPIGSALAPGILGNSFSESFTPDTPDTPGCYRIRLAVIGTDGSTACDVKNFCVPTEQGWILPPFKATAGELNFPGNTEGWESLLNQIFLDISDAISDIPSSDGWIEADPADYSQSRFAVNAIALTSADVDLRQRVNNGMPLRILRDEPYETGSHTGIFEFSGMDGFGPENITTADRLVRVSIAASGGGYVLNFYNSMTTDDFLLCSTEEFTTTGSVNVATNANGITGTVNVDTMPTGAGTFYINWYQYAIVDNVTSGSIEISGDGLPLGSTEIMRLWYGPTEKVICVKYYIGGDFQASGTITNMLSTYLFTSDQWQHHNACICRMRAWINDGTYAGGEEPDIGLRKSGTQVCECVSVPDETWTQALVGSFVGDDFIFTDKEDVELDITVRGGTGENLTVACDWVIV